MSHNTQTNLDFHNSMSDGLLNALDGIVDPELLSPQEVIDPIYTILGKDNTIDKLKNIEEYQLILLVEQYNSFFEIDTITASIIREAILNGIVQSGR